MASHIPTYNPNSRHQLYIANASMQVIDFCYRLPGNPSPRRQSIPIGQQIKISGDLTIEEMQAVINHHRQYGLVMMDEAESVRGTFGGMIYSIDSPVPSDQLGFARRVRLDALIEQGKQIRKEAAISVSNQIESNLGENMGLNGLEMTVQEEDRKLIGDEEAGVRISEGVRVRRDADTGPEPVRGRGRPRKAA